LDTGTLQIKNISYEEAKVSSYSPSVHTGFKIYETKTCSLTVLTDSEFI